MGLIFSIILVSFFPVIIASYILFDRLVRREYYSHHGEWNADGQPHGFFWVPQESTFAGGWLVRLGSSVAMHRKSYVWLFATPAWMKQDRKARRLIYCLRALLFGWYLALVVTFILMFFA